MKKNILIAGASAFALAAAVWLLRRCTGTETGLHRFFFPANQAKRLGRTAFHPETGTLWCSQSGSGIAFSFCGKECTLYLTADSACSGGEAFAARYAVYLNDTLASDAQLTGPEQTVRLVNPCDEKTPARVRLIKLSESQHSSLGIRPVCIGTSRRIGKKRRRELFTAEESRAHLIEFIGDSITCGYGVEGRLNADSFRTATENVMKAYAYLTAEKLHADYSMVCYSGHGIISGYTANGTAVTNQLVPRYYGETGHCTAVLEGRRRIQDDLWDFAVQPDLVVINLGTNDSSFTGTDPDRQQKFTAAYTAFLKTVREKNPAAQILCTLGIMGQTLCDAVEQAVSDYRDETGDPKIETMRFAEQSGADGYAVDWHPSAETHRKAAESLSAFIQDRFGW